MGQADNSSTHHRNRLALRHSVLSQPMHQRPVPTPQMRVQPASKTSIRSDSRKEDAREDGVSAGSRSDRDSERATGGEVDGGVDPGAWAAVCGDVRRSRAAAVVNGYGFAPNDGSPVEGIEVKGAVVSGRKNQV